MSPSLSHYHQLYPSSGISFSFTDFFLWLKKIFSSHLCLQIQPVFKKFRQDTYLFQSPDSCIRNLNHPTSSFCPCLFPDVECTGMFSFSCLCMHIFMLLIFQEKKPFWILVQRGWECRSALLFLERWHKAARALLVFLTGSTFSFSLFPFAVRV